MSHENLQIKESSSIAAAAYDRHRRILRLRYKLRSRSVPTRPSTYDYFDVPADMVQEFQQAESLGRFVNWRIKPHYRYAPVD
jgi:hypothetical protein